MNLKSGKLIGHVIAGMAIIVWGTTFISSKILLGHFTPVQVMIMRFIIAYITLFIMNHKIQKTTIKEELGFLSLAVMGSTVYFLLENRALTLSTAANVSIILSVAPLLTAILAHFFTKDEKINGMLLIGSLIAFIGVALVVFNGTIVLRLNPTGDMITICAALSWAIYSILLKKYVNNYDSVYITRKVVFYSILTTIPILLAEHKPFPVLLIGNPMILFNLLFLGALGSGICYVGWNIAVIKLGIVTTNNYIYVSPFITMVVAGILLHEKVTVMGLVGALLIVGGVVAAGKKINIKNSRLSTKELQEEENIA